MRYLITAIIAFSSYNLLTPSKEPIIAFIDSLTNEQKSKVIFAVDHERRTDWHYLPAGSYERPGIKMKELKDHQRKLLLKILESVLSEKGYRKTNSIIDLENILAELENNYTHRDPDQYAIAIFGNPKSNDPWSWSFSGHHISYHFTYVGGELSTTPRFLGANPATVQEGPKKGLRVLGTEEDLGFKLLNSMTNDQKSKAIITEESYYEILTRNEAMVNPLEKKGIKEDELTADQQIILHDLIEEYLSTLKQTLAQKRLKTIDQESLIFAWAGATEKGKAHYYRIQGQTFLIEFDNAQNNANHIHTVWRDFEGDFGMDLIKEHRANHQH